MYLFHKHSILFSLQYSRKNAMHVKAYPEFGNSMNTHYFQLDMHHKK